MPFKVAKMVYGTDGKMAYGTGGKMLYSYQPTVELSLGSGSYLFHSHAGLKDDHATIWDDTYEGLTEQTAWQTSGKQSYGEMVIGATYATGTAHLSRREARTTSYNGVHISNVRISLSHSLISGQEVQIKVITNVSLMGSFEGATSDPQYSGTASGTIDIAVDLDLSNNFAIVVSFDQDWPEPQVVSPPGTTKYWAEIGDTAILTS